MAGGLLGGPAGVLLGGGVGFVWGALTTAKNMQSFKPLHQVLSEMDAKDKKKLVQAAMNVIERRGINIARQIVGNYASQFCKTLMQQILKEFQQ